MPLDLFEEFGITPGKSHEAVDLFELTGTQPKPKATWVETGKALGKMLGEVGKSTVGGLLQFANDTRQEGLDIAQAATDRAAVLEAGRDADPSTYQNTKSLHELQNLFTEDVGQVKNKGRYQYALQQIDQNRKDAETQSGIGRMMFETSMKRQREIRPDFAPDDWGKELVFDAGVAAEKMVPSLVVGAATRSPVLATAAMAPTVLGDSYGGYIQQGHSSSEARQHAIVQTLIETGTEIPVFGRLFKTVGKTGLRKMFEVSLGEGLSESVSSLLSTAYEAGVIRDDMTLAEAFTTAQTYKNAAYEGAVGALLGFGMGGAMVPFDVAKQKRVIEDLKNSAADMQFTVWNDKTLNNAIDVGSQLAEEHGDKELTQIIDVLKAEQSRRADEAANASAMQQLAPAKQGTDPVPDKSIPGAQPDAFADLDPGTSVGLATLGLPAADADLNTQPEGESYQPHRFVPEVMPNSEAFTMAPPTMEVDTTADLPGGLAQFALPGTDSPTPEAPETLAAQMEAFAAGRKPAVLITPGEKLPEIPEGAQTAEIPNHGTLIFKDPALLELAQAGRMGDALGYGIEGKPVSDTVVTAKDARGRVVQDVLTDGRPEVLVAAKQVAGPDGTVEVRPAAKALQDRETANKAKAPTKAQKIRQVDPLNDSLSKIVAKLGGINKEEAAANGIDPADMRGFRAGLLPAFTRPGNTRQGGIKGDSLDGMRERVNQYGFNFETEADFLNALMEEMGGKPIYTAEGEAFQFEKSQPTYLQPDTEGKAPAAPKAAQPLKKLTKKAMAAMWPNQDWEYEAEDIDAPIIDDYDPAWDEQSKNLADLAVLAERYDEAVVDLLESSQSDTVIAAKLWEIIQNGRKGEESSRVDAEKEGTKRPAEATRPEEAAKDFELTAQSEADIRAKESRERDETIAAKDQADKEAEHFGLIQQTDDTPQSPGQGLFTPDGRPAAQADIVNTQPQNTAVDAVRFSGNEFGRSGIKGLLLKAKEFAKKQFSGKKVVNRDDGSEIKITWSGIKKSTSGQVSRNAAIVLSKLDDVIASGKLVSSESDNKNRNTIKAVHSYDTPIVVKGNRSLIRIVVRESTDGRRYYDHFEVRNEESPAPGEPKKDSDQEVSGASNRQSPAGVGSVTHKSQEDGEPSTGSGRNSKKTNKINKETSLISIAEISDEDFETLIDSLTQAEIPQAETNKPRAVKTKKRTIKKRTPAQKKREAAAILKKVRAQGVKGADEALTGLAELFGGKGKLSSGFTFDEETYAKAKPHFKAALESFVETGKSLAEFIKFIVDNFGTGVKPYLIQFHKDMKADKIKIRGIHNDADSRADQAGDSAESADQERSNQKDATDADNDAGRAAGDAAVEPGEAGLDPQSDLSLHQSEPAVSGEPSNAGVPETEGRPGTAGAPAESGDAGRAADAGAARIPDGAEGSGRPEEDADAYRRSVVEKLKLQKAANKIPLTYGDPANVRDTLPFLLPEQQDDVMFAERRFLSGKEPGVLFTNGTGTGKTYTALGIIKRHMRDTGSNDVLIVVPAGKVNDWIEDARNLQISAAKLESKKDAGQDVTVTSYQNFQDNWELQARDFSLIVYDESHYLGQSAVGETMAYVMHRAAANHDDGLYWKAWIRDPKAKELEYARRKFIDNEVKRLESLAVDQKAGKDEREDAADNVANKEKLRKRLDKEFRERHQGEYHKIHDRARDQQEPLKEKYHNSNRVLFLSASPFAYHRSIDYAEGYLFSYSQEEERQGYYTITPRDQFFISNFGYRFRYGRLTTPDKDVDVSLMERRFNEQLKREGAVSGRMLEVDYDYSREFVIFNSELGEKVDRGLNVLRGLSPDGEYLNKEEMEVAGHPVFEELPNILRKKFTYSYLSQLTEAIKAENLTDRIHKHLGMGRKVVVFHDFQKTVDSHPFRFNDTPVPARNDPGQQIALAEKIRAEIDAFNSHYPELGKLRLDKLKSVVETISDTFGDRVAVIKGGVSANKKTALIKKYQANDSAIDVIVVQRQSGREGISLHDITGTHQRALIDMGLPIRPVDSLQTEGRVYRFAVKSDAVIEYPVLGTTFERIMFANKVAERSRTAENLAMGNLARDMERAFKEGYVDASDFDPHAKQGRGGKERDRTRREDDPFDIAKTLYFGRRKNTKRRDHREGLDYFSTPEPLGLKMVEWAGARPGERGLEPSAGHGAIARWFPEETRNVFVEPSARLAGEVGLLSNGAAEISTFEDLPVESKYDFVVMNPPFGSGGATAIKHIDKAMRHLKNGGRIVALIPEGPAANKKLEALLYGKARELEKLKEAYKNGLITGGERDSRLRQLQNFHVMADIGLPSVTFERAGTQVKTHILVIDRYDNPEDVPSRKGRVDLNHKDINELFEAIQYMEGPRRGVVSEPEKTGQVELETKKPEHAGVVKAKGFHTKKQKDIWYVHLTGPRIARDDFLVMKDKAKDLDGYYSAWKGNGAKPGFIFNTEEDANKFMDEYASYFGGETLYSRGGQQTAAPLSYGLLSDVVDNLVDQFAHQPPIRIIERVEDVHAAPLTEGDTSIICGFVRDGRIHLVRSAIPDAATASNTLWHELLHYGLRRFLTRDQYISDMHDLYSRDAWIKQYADRWVSGKGGEDLRRKGRSSDYIKAVGVDEALATLGEAVGGTTSGFQKTGKKAKAIRAVVRWLSGIAERLGFKNVAAWLRGITNEEARLYVHAIYGKLAADATATVDDWAFTADPAFMVRRRRGANDRASDELKSRLGLHPKKGNIKKTIKQIRSTPPGDLKRHLSDEFTQGSLDRFFGIKAAEERYTGPLDASQSGYVAARLATGLSSIMTATLHYGTPRWEGGILQRIPDSKGLLEILEPVGEELNDWLAWMGGKRAKRLMREGRENNLTKENIEEALVLSQGREDRFKAVADEYAEFMGRILDVAQGAGLIKAEDRTAWEYADYVPFYRMSVDDMFRGAKRPMGNKGLSHQTAGIRRLRGGEEATNDLLENIIMNVTHLLDASLKNAALGKTLRNLKGTGVYEDATMEFKRELIPMSQVREMIERNLQAQGWPEDAIEPYLDLMPREVISGLQKMWAMKAPDQPDVVRVMINGKARYYRISDPLLLRAMTQVNTEKDYSVPMNVMRSFKRLLTATVTASPEFMLRNFARDALHAYTINEDQFTPIVDSVRGAAKTLKLWAQDVDHEAVGGAVDMMFAGGSFLGGYISGTDPTETAVAIRKALRKRGLDATSADAFLGSVIDTAAKYWDKYREIGDAIENASREAVYESAIKAGKSKAQATFEAKDLMDYSMQGQYAIFQFLGDVVPFFNARLQGLYKLKRAGAIPGWASKTKVLARGGLIAAASLALLAWNWDDEDYEALPDWDKDLYWHFFFDLDGKKEHVRIPKPFEVGVIYGTIPERMARYFGGKDDERKAMKQLLWNIRESLNLVQMPQIGKPIFEVISNKDSFTGYDIEGMADEGKKKSARYNEQTSATMRKLGEAFGDTTGLSPKQLEHLWRGYLGTLGMYALGVSDLAVNWTTDAPERPDLRPDQLPVIKSFYRGSEPARTTRYKTEMYDMLRELEQINKTIRAYAKEGRRDEAKALANKENVRLKGLGPLRGGANAASTVRKRIDAIIRNRDMTGKEKRQEINLLYQKQNKLLKRVVEKAYPYYITGTGQ